MYKPIIFIYLNPTMKEYPMKDNLFYSKDIGKQIKLPIPEKGTKTYRYNKNKSLWLRLSYKGTFSYVAVLKNGKRITLPQTDLTEASDECGRLRLEFKEKGKIEKGQLRIAEDLNITFHEMATKYLEWSKKHKKETSIKADRERLRNHILPVLQDKNPTEISSREINTLLNSLIGKKNTYKYLQSLDGHSVKFITKDKVMYWLNQLGYGYIEIDNSIVEDLDYTNLQDFLSLVTKDETSVAKYMSKQSKYLVRETETTHGTFNKCKALLSHMYNTAMTWEGSKWEQIQVNPCVGIKSTKPKQKNRYLDNNELDRLKAVLNADEYKTDTIAHLVKFLVLTGARRSEALTAKWEHIDFNNKVWRKPEKNSKTKLAPPVPINKDVINLLMIMKKKSSTGYIFKSSKDSNKPINDFRKSFNNIMAKADIKDVNPHDLRRTFGTQLLLKGKDIFSVSKLLGHESVKTTESHYAFLNRETLHNAVNVLDGIL